jgi:hypothetical protein
MLEGFQAEGPIVSGGSIDKDQGKFEAPNRDAVAKGDVDVDNVQVLCGETVDGFSTWGFGNCGVGSKGEREFTGINQGAILCSGNNVLVVPKAAASSNAVEFFGSERSLGLRRVGCVTWSDWRQASVWVMQLSDDLVLRHTF